MSHFDRALRSQFFLTGPRPCPYLPGRKERKLFTNLSGPHAAGLHDDLALHGFRRSQNIAYRPACAGCHACLSTRVRVADFEPTKAQRRVLRRNEDVDRRVDESWSDPEHYALFRAYVSQRHADGGMTDMDYYDFGAMIEDSPVRTRLFAYRAASGDEPEATARETRSTGDEAAKGALLGACLTDLLADGLSLVYSYFNPDEKRRSLGQYIILDHIALAKKAKLPYVYLGYWVPGSAKMNYKINFQPAEILTDRGWVLADEAAQAAALAAGGAESEPS